ncbi:MAG TPA: dihydropteroate synthase [Syntrophorhabdaceae bacterium]|jgi:5-methyltetrahydrofolate corrinoid/iron sulfur protein methyltransferase
MILIGENLNIMSTRIGKALADLDPAPIRARAVAEAEAGMDMLDINLGPLRKEGPRLMEWVVKNVQEVTDLPLSLDTTSVEAIEAGLRVCKGKALINSISARPERMEALMPLAKRYGARFIGMTIGTEGLPRDGNERGLLAAMIVAKAAEYGIPEEDIWLDPLVLPVNTQQLRVGGCTDFIIMAPELFPQCRSMAGLSNISHGAPMRLRGILDRTYLLMLRRYGLHAAIVNAFDGQLQAIARGERPDLEALVYRVMDGEAIDTATVSDEEKGYVKTARILLGQTVYSDSWLEY